MKTSNVFGLAAYAVLTTFSIVSIPAGGLPNRTPHASEDAAAQDRRGEFAPITQEDLDKGNATGRWLFNMVDAFRQPHVLVFRVQSQQDFHWIKPKKPKEPYKFYYHRLAQPVPDPNGQEDYIGMNLTGGENGAATITFVMRNRVTGQISFATQQSNGPQGVVLALASKAGAPIESWLSRVDRNPR